MSDRQQRMLAAFRSHEARRRSILVDHSVVGVPIGTRLQRIIRFADGWRLWVATRDYTFGTFYEMNNDGRIYGVTLREDEGPEEWTIRPSDDYIANNNEPRNK